MTVCAVVQAPAGPSAAQTAALDKEAADRLAERLQGSLGKPLQQSIRQVGCRLLLPGADHW